MSFLSLSKGDPAARELLQRAIRARYGIRPVPIDNLRLWLSRPDKGPLGLPVELCRTLSFSGATHWQQADVSKLFGLGIKRVTASFEPLAYYEKIGRAVKRLDNSDVLRASRRFVWTHVAYMLTPLTTEGITLKLIDDSSFQAIRDADTAAVATITLDSNDEISVEGEAYYALAGQITKMKLYGQGPLQTFDGFAIPVQLVYQWGEEQPEAFTVTKVAVNPDIPKSEYALDEPTPK